jgi:hypothetical protein
MPELEIKPWLSIWVKPKQTVRALINYNVKYRFFVLSLLYGLPTMLQMAQNLSLGSVFSLPAIILASLILSPIFGCLGLLLCTAFITWTGRWLGGKGSFLEMRCGVSWTNATNLVTVLVWGALIAQFKEVIFYEGFARMPMTVNEASCLSVYFFIQLVVAVWSFVLLLYAVSEVHRFSIWKALLNIVIAFVVGVAVSWVVIFAIERIADLRV